MILTIYEFENVFQLYLMFTLKIQRKIITKILYV
jgi:hypothetical protein